MTIDTPTDANTKDAMPSKSVKAKPQAKLRGCELMKIYCATKRGDHGFIPQTMILFI
jgi:hypothetical protein